jgi:hypothetical protein
VRRALDDRLTLSEALEATGRMIRGYPQKAPESYLGAIAETLMHYPKSVALACANPFGGVVRQSPEFMPSQSRVIQWCEKHCRSLYAEATRETRIAEQVREREAWLSKPRTPSLLAKTKSWLDRTDPAAKQLSGPILPAPIEQEAIEIKQEEERNAPPDSHREMHCRAS